jgi:SAM-dependent methyltransferase
LSDTAKFYDALADDYRLIYADWDASVHRQARALDQVIAQYFGGRPKRVLDAACGIGTQAIGLASLGYEVCASDLSSAELAKAKEIAASRNLTIDFHQADMRHVDWVFPGTFDLVIACDNAIPHLLTDEDILQAFESFRRALRIGGGAIISVRDYAATDRGGTQVHPRLVHDRDGIRHILCEVRDFDGEYYSITMYVIRDNGRDPAEVKAIRGGRYYCVSIDKLVSLFCQAGFAQVDVLHDAFFQPLLIATKREKD